MFGIMGEGWRSCAANYGQVNLINELRKLWMEHVMWTRLFIISTLSGLADLDVTTKRLLRNPTDFARILEIFYGRDKADTFRRLLEEHLKVGGAFVENVNQGNAKAADQYLKLWYRNADQIAAFLAEINPFWSEERWRKLLYDHLRMITDVVNARLQGEYQKDSVIADMMTDQGLEMADAMAAGMIRQFNL